MTIRYVQNETPILYEKKGQHEISFGASFGIECRGFLQNHIRNDDLVRVLVHSKHWPK